MAQTTFSPTDTWLKGDSGLGSSRKAQEVPRSFKYESNNGKLTEGEYSTVDLLFKVAY